MLNIQEIRRYQPQIMQIAKMYAIRKVYIFGSVARGENTPHSDIDFLVELEEGASYLGIGGFLYETEQLLGLQIDVIPASLLPKLKDQRYVENIRSEAIPL